MAQNLVWLDAASRDFFEICSYIDQDSPEAAARFAQRVVTAAESLPELPHRGRHVRELAGHRELVLGNYRLVYRVSGDTVYISRLIHSRRDFLTAWQGEGEGPPADLER